MRAIQFKITDDAFPSHLIAAAQQDWPSPDWPDWHSYADGKRASRSVYNVPRSIAMLLSRLAEVATVSGTFPDLSFYGSGLHELPADVGLGWHRDSEKHPLRPWRRVATSILYLDSGGDIVFRGPNEIQRLPPKPGRMVTFSADDPIEHCVEPAGRVRRSLTVFHYAETPPDFTGRTSADFAKPIPNCRHCGSRDMEFLVLSIVVGVGARFYTCRKCGCVTSDTTYEAAQQDYQSGVYLRERMNVRQFDFLKNECTTNVEWLTAADVPEKSILDVGCMECAVLSRFADAGWDCHGWDVDATLPADLTAGGYFDGSRVTTGDEFYAASVGRKFGAVISREVIEHVPNHHRHFAELVKAVMPGGLLQIQTPRPLDNIDDQIVYQWPHLLLLSPDALRGLFSEHGLSIEREHLWDGGQLMQGRK